MRNFQSQSTTTSYGQWCQRRQIQLTDRTPSLVNSTRRAPRTSSKSVQSQRQPGIGLNNTLRIITGYTQTTPTNHIHYETQVITLQDKINMRGTQLPAAASENPDHPCHYMLAHQPTPRSIKTNPQALYTGLLNTIPLHSSSHIHTHFTNMAIQKLGPNTILGTRPPEINHSERALPCADRVHHSRLRFGHHTAQATYQTKSMTLSTMSTHTVTLKIYILRQVNAW